MNDWYKAGKVLNNKLSFRFIARQLGLKSPNHFQLVITRQRHFSKPTLAKMQKILKLSSREKSYLDLLFAHSQEKSPKKLTEIEQKITRLGTELLSTEVNFETYALLANSLAWYMKMGALRFHGKSGDEIRDMVLASCPFPLTAADVQAALDLLETIKGVRVEEGSYLFEMDNLKTEWDFDDMKIKQFHYNNMLLAMQSIPWPIQKRFFSNLTIPCNPDMVETVKKEIRDLCLKLLNLSNSQIQNEADCQQVMSLQFAFFPYFLFEGKALG